MNRPDTSQWLRISQPRPQARLRLFCFPYAGGAASIYRLWHQHLPSDIEVCAIQLPGRENRIREQPFTHVADFVQVLMPNLLSYLDRPFAFFGHSMGTLIAYELTCQLWQQSGQLPTQLFVSGRRAPILPESDSLLHPIASDDAFLAELQQRYNNIPQIIFEDAEMKALFLPLLRADLTLVETYQYSERAKLPCPIIAFGGDDDTRAPQTELIAWQALTQADFALHMLPGGHFYLNEESQSLLQLLAGYLRSVSNTSRHR